MKLNELNVLIEMTSKVSLDDIEMLYVITGCADALLAKINATKPCLTQEILRAFDEILDQDPDFFGEFEVAGMMYAAMLRTDNPLIEQAIFDLAPENWARLLRAIL